MNSIDKIKTDRERTIIIAIAVAALFGLHYNHLTGLSKIRAIADARGLAAIADARGLAALAAHDLGCGPTGIAIALGRSVSAIERMLQRTRGYCETEKSTRANHGRALAAARAALAGGAPAPKSALQNPKSP